MTVLFFLRRVGPYHFARFNAVEKLKIVAVETRAQSQEYPWQFNEKGRFKIERFPVSDDVEFGVRGSILYQHISRLIDTYNPNVIVTTGWADPEYHAAVVSAKSRKIPLVVISDSCYEDVPRRFYKEFVKGLIVKSYSAALVAGTKSRNYLLTLGFSENRIFQPWDVVDNIHFYHPESEVVSALEEKNYLCVSRFVPKKNLHGLLESYGKYINQGGKRKLTLLGSGELESQLSQQIRSLGIEDQISLHGFVQYDRLPNFYRNSFCLILPSLTDQWGLVVNEAMAAGLPVLVSDKCGCACDLVENGINGFTFDPLNRDQLTNLLHLMDQQPRDKIRKMSRASQEVISNWDLESFSKGLTDACEYAIAYPSYFASGPLHKILSR